MRSPACFLRLSYRVEGAGRATIIAVHGEEDAIPLDHVREWATAMPNARLVPVPNAGHFAYAERSEV